MNYEYKIFFLKFKNYVIFNLPPLGKIYDFATDTE